MRKLNWFILLVVWFCLMFLGISVDTKYNELATKFVAMVQRVDYMETQHNKLVDLVRNVYERGVILPSSDVMEL